MYLIDWGYSGSRRLLADALDGYINGYIDRSVDAVAAHAGVDKINPLGIRQGGAFAVLRLDASDKVKNLITMVTHRS